MRRLAMATAVSAVVMLVAQPSFAGDRERTYVANALFTCCGPTDTPAGQVDTTLPVGMGGYEFAASGDPKSLRVVDAGGSGVPAFVCQEGPSQAGETPNSCGLGDDVSQLMCSNNNFQSLNPNFTGAAPVLVFIGTVDVYGGGCEGLGTAGTVTLRTA